MNPDRPTVYFVREVPWDTVFPVSTRMLAAEFARDGWNVAWLNPPLMPWHSLTGKRRLYADRGGRMVSRNVFALTPSGAVPFSRHFPLDRPWLADNLWRGCWPPLRQALRAHGVPAPNVLFLSHWSAFGIRHLFPGCPIVYHVTDHYEGMPSVPRTLAAIQRRNLAIADHLIVTAPFIRDRLVETYGVASASVAVIMHGVDADAYAGPPAEPAELAGIARPRIVALGNLGKLPFDGLAALAAELGGQQIILLGPRNQRVDALVRRFPNVHALGEVAPPRVPAFLSHCDVGLVAFGEQIGRFVEGICPMKLFEYAAAGLPVVATPLPVYDQLDLPVAVAGDWSAFADEVRNALAAPQALRERMRTFARANTWRARYRECLPDVERLLVNRPKAWLPA